MKTIEMAYIFPFTLFVMVTLILLSFSLHDMILYKASSYKFLVSTGPNTSDYSTSSEDDISLLNSYINRFSLTNNYVDIEQDASSDHIISISTNEYNGRVCYMSYDKCDILRKCMAAGELIHSLTEE